MSPEESTLITIQVGKIEQKLDDTIGALEAIHISLKEDIHDLREDVKEVEVQTRETNGRVTNHDKALAFLKGAIFVLTTATPFLLFALDKLSS